MFESGVDPRQPGDRVRLVDDPRVLRALQDELSLRPELAQSRRIVTRSCLIRDRRYVTIAMDSLKRILRTNGVRVVARGDGPEFEPIATGAIEAVRLSDRAGATAPHAEGANAPQ